jgi:glycine betaine catabolism B
MLAPLFCSQDGVYWDREHDNILICLNARHETHDVKTFTFVSEDGRYFNFRAGQYFTFEVPIQGAVEQRCYSISSSPLQPRTISITVKRVTGGLVSNWLHDNLEPGAAIRAQGPSGGFTPPAGGPGKYLLLSGGSGITPLMSISRAFGDAHQYPDIVFLHAARTPLDFIFRDELVLRAKQSRNFRLILLPERLDGRPEFPGLVGRISRDFIAAAVPDVAERLAMCCGPAPFMKSARAICRELGTAPERYLEESFEAPAIADEFIAIDAALVSFNVTFAKQARTIAVSAGQSVLAAARKSGVRLPSSCANGICGTCKSKLVSGVVDMKHGGGIRQREIDAGMFLPCCSTPLSDLVVDR